MIARAMHIDALSKYRNARDLCRRCAGRQPKPSAVTRTMPSACTTNFMGRPREVPGEVVGGTVFAALDPFLDWCQKHRALSSKGSATAAPDSRP